MVARAHIAAAVQINQSHSPLAGWRHCTPHVIHGSVCHASQSVREHRDRSAAITVVTDRSHYIATSVAMARTAGDAA